MVISGFLKVYRLCVKKVSMINHENSNKFNKYIKYKILYGNNNQFKILVSIL